MRKLVIGVGLAIAAALVIRRLVKKGGPDWEAMLDRMPDTAPPKWMFTNISAIRENTDRILARLDADVAADTP
jgi:hypothetical protein